MYISKLWYDLEKSTAIDNSGGDSACRMKICTQMMANHISDLYETWDE